MNETINIVLFTRDVLDDVLALIKKSDSTNRTKETWLRNEMTAILAYDGDQLIGIIPFEKRNIIINDNELLKVLWVSAAHVDPDYRSQGIGTQLDNKIKDEFYPEFKAVFVIREDEQSAAYRWYKKLGYHHLTNILSFKYDVLPSDNEVEHVVMGTAEDFKNNGAQLKSCFDRNIGKYGGYPKRDKCFWHNKFNAHYYKDHYVYKIVAIKGEGNSTIEAYALMGQTNYRDGVDRIDILEISMPNDSATREMLLQALLNNAHQFNCCEVRVQCTENDPLVAWFKDFGFSLRWQTNLLGKYIDSGEPITGVSWKFFQTDYI